MSTLSSRICRKSLYFKLQSVPLCPAHLLTFIEPPPDHAIPWEALAVHAYCSLVLSAFLEGCGRRPCVVLLAQAEARGGQSLGRAALDPSGHEPWCPERSSMDWCTRKLCRRTCHQQLGFILTFLFGAFQKLHRMKPAYLWH